MSDPTLPSFRYRLEQQPPRTDCGGVVRGASVRQFPVSQGIGGASMRLQPGCLRELHWHTTAAELGYVVSGSCRTTVLSPDGAATDTFGPGDVWYFPAGWGHSILGTGPGECHFILMFDNGAFSEDHTLSISDWLAHTSPAVVSQNLGLGMEWTAKLPKGETYFAGGPFLMTPSRVLRPSRSRHLQRRIAIHWGPSNHGACRAAAHSGRLPRTSFRSRPHCPSPCWRSSRAPCVNFTGIPTPTSGNTILRVRLRWVFIWGWVTQ